MDLTVSATVPLLGFGAITLLLSIIFYCYLCRIRHKNKYSYVLGYRQEPFPVDGGNDTCPVCLEEYTIKEVIAVCPCGHCFHIDCLMMWLEFKHWCPVCKGSIRRYSTPTSNSRHTFDEA